MFLKPLRKDLWLITLVAIPFIYLFIIWNGLPETVPVHWNLEGEIDRYGSKGMLWMIPIMLPLLTNAIFLLVARFDSNGQLSKMGLKYERLYTYFVLKQENNCPEQLKVSYHGTTSRNSSNLYRPHRIFTP